MMVPNERIQSQFIEILCLAIALAFVVVGCGKAAPSSSLDADSIQSQREQRLKRELASLQKRYKSSQARLESLQRQFDSGDSGPLTSFMLVPDILDEMFDFRTGSKNRRSHSRRLNFLLESLIRQGDIAVPHIREFLNRMEDVDYAIRREGEKDDEYEKRYRNFRATLNFSQPPSMRIALIDVLAEIGGSLSESTLVEVLSTTGRGLEVAYTAKALQGMLGKDAYSNKVLSVTHELLIDPVVVSNGNHFDRVSKNYLFMVLDMYNDQTFVQSAKGMFINDDGRIDRTILNYFDNTGKEQSLDAIVQAFRSGRVNESDMDNLAASATRFVGKNPQADQLFRDIITNDQYNLEIKRDAVQSLLSSDGDVNTPGVAPDLMQARLDLINSIQFDESDLMGKGMELLGRQIEFQLSGDKNAARKVQEEARRIISELEKRERNNKRSERSNSLNNLTPTIVPAQ
jgi:hypothetical protein